MKTPDTRVLLFGEPEHKEVACSVCSDVPRFDKRPQECIVVPDVNGVFAVCHHHWNLMVLMALNATLVASTEKAVS